MLIWYEIHFMLVFKTFLFISDLNESLVLAQKFLNETFNSIIATSLYLCKSMTFWRKNRKEIKLFKKNKRRKNASWWFWKKKKFVKTKVDEWKKKFKTFLDVEEYIKTKQKIYLNKVNSAIFSMKYWNGITIQSALSSHRKTCQRKKLKK